MNIRIVIGVILLLLLAAAFLFRSSPLTDSPRPDTPKNLAQPSAPGASAKKSSNAPAVTKASINRARRLSFLRQLPGEDAVVLSETTNGVTTTSALDYWQLTTTQEKLDFLSEEISAHGPLASSDVLALFQNEKDPAVLDELLSYATLPDYDANIQSIFSLALRPDQPADLRLAALAYAADADPSVAAAFQNDANPDLRLAARSMLNALPASPAAPMSN